MLQNRLHVCRCPYYCSLISINNNNNFACAHFLHISLPLFCTTTSWNVLVTRSMEELSYGFVFAFFSLPLIFTSVDARIYGPKASTTKRDDDANRKWSTSIVMVVNVIFDISSHLGGRRTYGRCHVITKMSRICKLTFFLTRGTLLRAQYF